MPERKNAIKIFISYAREDGRDMAQRLRDDLHAIGYDVWLDLSEIEGGASWSRDIEGAIETCDLALALLSSGSYVSEICRAEQLRALRKGKRVIPALVQPDAERPLHLEHLNYLDFSNPAEYDDTFRDLLSDITAGRAFIAPTAKSGSRTISPAGARRKGGVRPYAADEKRDARAFRRYIADLHEENWLGARYWWPYFLFYFADMQDVAAILKRDALLSPAAKAAAHRPRRKVKRDRWDTTARLYFRPRTPDLFSSEGFRPVERQRVGTYCPLPVYLLFDLEAVICQAETRFTEGDLDMQNKTFKAASAFRDMPFELIYHDSWFTSDERDEVMYHRRAQAIVPQKLGLESLQYIWCRSQAEYETLRQLLPSDIWRKWRDKLTARTDYTLFNRKWVYVDRVTLDAQTARVHFNLSESQADSGPFSLRVEIEAGGQKHDWRDDDYMVNGDLVLDLTGLQQAGDYVVRLYLNDDLAYAGRCDGGGVL